MCRARNARQVLLGASLLALGALGLASGSGAALRADGELYVNYIGSTTVQVMLGGQIVRSGGSIPAGTYTVYVSTDGFNNNPRFLMSGPGVSVVSDLNPSGMGVGVDGASAFGPYNFPGGASYTVQQQGGPAVTFSTSGSAAAGSSGGSSGGSLGSSSGGSTGATGSSTSGGSSSTKTMGTLKGSVSAIGKSLLGFGGRIPKTLKAGRYTVAIVDQSRKAGLIVGQASKRPITLSAGSATGTTSHSVTLSPGKWFFASSTTGPKTYFTVTE